jgi:uncharacterized membrane protein
LPSAILIGCVSPVQALYFIIFVLVLQQFDGNLLGPKILGNSVGVSSFMVLVAILIGGGLFGFIGMIIGVPLCAILTSVLTAAGYRVGRYTSPYVRRFNERIDKILRDCGHETFLPQREGGCVADLPEIIEGLPKRKYLFRLDCGHMDWCDTLLFVFDGRVLDEGAANVAYELTWLAVGIVAAVYVLAIKRDKLHVKDDGEKLIGGVFETAGQLAYVYAIGDTEHVGFAAAIISAYCAVSVLWSRIFLKEKLSWKHYASIALAVTGIVILGVFDA